MPASISFWLDQSRALRAKRSGPDRVGLLQELLVGVDRLGSDLVRGVGHGLGMIDRYPSLRQRV